MDGLELPHALVWVLARIGIVWPEAKEFRMAERAADVVRWCEDALKADKQATAAADTMLATNQSQALDSFRGHFDKVAGSSGYLMRAGVGEAATGAVLTGSTAVVLAFKLSVIEFLGALAVTFPEAVATAPEGLAAWWKLARTVQGEVRTAQKAAITTITHLGGPLARLAGSLLDEEIKHLDTRPIHTSSAGVHSYRSPADRAAAAAARQRRWDQLSKDADHKNSRDEDTEKSRREADVALGLEDAGMFPPGSVSRAPAGGGDFVVTLPDGTQQSWDIKRVPSYTGPNPPVSDVDKDKQRDGYSTKTAIRLIEKQLRRGRKVVMDSSQLSDDDRRALIDLIRSRSDWADRVVVY